MPLSFEEKARLGDLYERNRRWEKFGLPASAFGGLVMPLVFVGRDFIQRLQESSAGKHVLSYCVAAILAGFVLGAILVLAILLTKLRRRDQETLAFAEKHFPEDCPWKEEEAVLRQAEELQRQAKASNVVASALRPSG